VLLVYFVKWIRLLLLLLLHSF